MSDRDMAMFFRIIVAYMYAVGPTVGLIASFDPCVGWRGGLLFAAVGTVLATAVMLMWWDILFPNRRSF